MAYTQKQAQEVAAGSLQAFMGKNRELLASFDVPSVEKALVAHTRLYGTEKLTGHLTSAINPEEQFGVALDFFVKHLGETFLRLYDEGRLQPVTTITSLGEKALADLRERTGAYSGGQIPEPPPKQLTAEELLEQEVRNDFVTLSGSKMKEKRRTNRAYEQMYQRIAYTLDSRITYSGIAGS
jgi:hypothetical protein